MAHLVIGHQFLFKFSQDAALFLGAGDDQLEGSQQVLLVHGLAAQTDRPEGGFVHQVGQISTHTAGGGQSDLL